MAVQRSFEPEQNHAFPGGRARSSRGQWPVDTYAAAGERYLEHYSRGDVADETTRYLAAATQVDISRARRVRRRIIGEPFRALAPVYGVDVAVVVCWALRSLRRRFWRDVALAVIFAAGVVLVSILPGLLPWHSWVPAFVITLLILVTGIVAWEKFQMRRTVVMRMRRGMFKAEDAPQPRSEKMRQRIAEVKNRSGGNLIVFQGISPFVGSGRTVGEPWHIVLDVSHGAKLRNGVRQQPVGFTSAELHAAILEALEDIGLPDAHAEERLFVNGRHLQDNPRLLRGWNPSAPPPASADDDVLRLAALRPTPDARVYVCAYIPSWQGQLVTTLFARAVHAGGSLYIEWRFHVLPPLSKLIPDIDHLYGEPTPEQVLKAFVLGLLYGVPAFLKAPFALVGHAGRRLTMKVRRSFQAWKIKHGQVFDYGAMQSIREDTSGFSAKDYFLESDEEMDISLVQEKLIRAIESFLEKHNIDLGEFQDQARVIMYSTQKTYNVGSAKGTGIIIGDQSSVSGVGNAEVPPDSSKAKE